MTQIESTDCNRQLDGSMLKANNVVDTISGGKEEGTRTTEMECHACTRGPKEAEKLFALHSKSRNLTTEK
jgi:hypothetical protein